MVTKTGKYYFKPKFFGGFDLYVEIKTTYLYGPTKYKYIKGNLADLGELKIMHDNQK